MEYCRFCTEDPALSQDMKADLFQLTGKEEYRRVKFSEIGVRSRHLRDLRSKGVEHLFIRKPDFIKYIDPGNHSQHRIAANVQEAKDATNAAQVPTEAKNSQPNQKEPRDEDLIKLSNQWIKSKLYLEGMDHRQLDCTLCFFETTLALVLEVKPLGDILRVIKQHSDYLFFHHIGVSFYSSYLARLLNWNSLMGLVKITLTGLFHDVGKKDFDLILIGKKEAEMLPIEITQLKSHVSVANEMLSSIRAVSSDILQAIAHHHEMFDGSGYPLGLRKSHIHPYARLISLIDLFCNLVLDHPSKEPRKSPSEAISFISSKHANAFDPSILKAFGSLFLKGGTNNPGPLESTEHLSANSAPKQPMTRQELEGKIIQVILGATKEVLSRQVSLHTDAVTAVNELPKDVLEKGVSGIVEFGAKNFTAYVALSFPEIVFCQFMAKMMQTEVSSDPQEVLDGACELAQIISIHAKRIFNLNHMGVTVSNPLVKVGKTGFPPEGIEGTRILFQFNSDLGQFYLQICSVLYLE